MAIKIYNVLTRKKEEFVPQERDRVKMYACGITASGDAHIGHALQAVVFDMIRKYFMFRGYDVTYVRNYTDVDDKIINRANEQHVDPILYAKRLMKKTDAELDALGVMRPTVESRVTECMEDIISFISVLIQKGYAYQTKSGDVLFHVDRFASYGSFSNRIADQQFNAVRIEADSNKQDEKDFALWKAAKEGEINWESPWGKGRPGWHIECSAMSIKYLGETLDIHGGGKDLIFPHHENEIAQSEAATGKLFSKYWIHNGLIKVNGQKMSKSLNNGILLEDMLREYNKDTIRLTLLQNHYSSDVNIMDGMFAVYEKHVYNYYKVFRQIDAAWAGKEIRSDAPIMQEVRDRFTATMDNDFNTAVAIADLIGYTGTLNQYLATRKIQEAAELKKAIIEIYDVIGVCQMDPIEVIAETKQKYLAKANLEESTINNLLELRKEAKANKDFAKADQIREELIQKSIEVRDTRNGVEWDLIF